MECPACGHTQPDGLAECQRCQIVFAKWRPRDSYPVPSRPLPPPPAHPKVDPIVLGCAAGILLCGLALWWVLVPRSNPVVPGSYVSQQHRFALYPPPDWVLLTRENMAAIMEEYGASFPKALRPLLQQNKNMAAAFFQIGGAAGQFAPSANVVVIEGTIPPIDDDAREEAARELAKVYEPVLEDYRQESVEIIETDGLTAIEIVSVGTLEFKVADAQYDYVENEWGWRQREKVADEEFARRTLRFRQVLVPGKKRAYVLTFTALDRRWEESANAFQRILDSFRVLQRPARYGPVLHGAVAGGLIGAMLGLLGMMSIGVHFYEE